MSSPMMNKMLGFLPFPADFWSAALVAWASSKGSCSFVSALVKSITFVFPLLHSSPLGAPAAAAIDELLDARFDVCELATDAFADRSNRIPPEATTYPKRAPATNMATAWRFLLRNIVPPSQMIEY